MKNAFLFQDCMPKMIENQNDVGFYYQKGICITKIPLNQFLFGTISLTLVLSLQKFTNR